MSCTSESYRKKSELQVGKNKKRMGGRGGIAIPVSVILYLDLLVRCFLHNSQYCSVSCLVCRTVAGYPPRSLVLQTARLPHTLWSRLWDTWAMYNGFVCIRVCAMYYVCVMMCKGMCMCYVCIRVCVMYVWGYVLRMYKGMCYVCMRV